MIGLDQKTDYISPEIILELYKSGIFLMGKERNDQNIYFVNPEKRALLPIKKFHCSKSFVRFCRKKPFQMTIDKCFQNVIRSCATVNREDTWINKIIEKKFIELHKMGYAHSIETWQEKELVGGIYGVSIGSCFFAESMFSKKSNASKFALINLVSRLNLLGYNLLDVQFVNPHLKQFGVYELTRNKFKELLNHALTININFHSLSFKDEDLFENVIDFLQEISIKS